MSIIVEIFDLTVGATGIADEHLNAAGIEHHVSITYSGSHACYYPGAEMMTIQLALAPGNGRLLGALVVRQKGVDKRLDVLAFVIRRGGAIYELIEMEHAYAPLFPPPKTR